MTWHLIINIGFAFVGVCALALIIQMICEYWEPMIEAVMQDQVRRDRIPEPDLPDTLEAL